MGKHLKMIGPVTIDVVVHLVTKEGTTAKVTVGMAPGKAITQKGILWAIKQAHDAGKDHGLHPMAPSTFFNSVLVKEKTGRVGNFAVPGSMLYEIPGQIEFSKFDAIDDEDEFEDD